jgi:2-(1,2-epoxy-1,2-dihydrophenyl)acetyl-CoA isomerase
MSEPEATTVLSSGVLTLTLNRPAQLNAMTPSMVELIIEATVEARQSGARAFLVRAEGRGFCAGRDLTGSQPGVEDGGEVLRHIFNPMVRAVADLAIPTIAAVQGACLGTGLGLALACDVLLVADTAKISSPFGRIGAVLDSGGHKGLVDRLGSAVAMDLIYSGRTLTGVEAAAAGLASRAIPEAKLTAVASDYAAQVAQGPVLAFAESKRLVRALSDSAMSLEVILYAEAAAQTRSSRTADYAEGFTAFLERRTPTFTGE